MRSIALSSLTKGLVFVLTTAAALISNDTRFLALLALVSMICYLNRRLKIHISLVLLVLCHLLVMYFIDPNHGVMLYQYNITWLYDFTLQETLYLTNIFLKDIIILNFLQYFILTSQPAELEICLTQLKLPYRLAYKIAHFFSLKYKFNTYYQQGKKAAIAQNKSFSKRRALLLFFKTEKNNMLLYRHFGKKRQRTWYQKQTFTTFDKLALLLALFSVIISISLIMINGARLWNPFI